MKIAYTVWTWMKSQFGVEISTEEARGRFEQAVKEIADLGYECVENFNFTAPLFEDYPEEFERIMTDNNVKFVNLYHSLSDDFDKDYRVAERCCKFLVKHGASLLNLEAPRRNGREATKEILDEVCRHIDQIGALCRSYGVTMCVHPHYGTFVETAEQIAYIDAYTNPETTRYCIDTCHCVLGKMDPAETFRKYGKKLAYVHFKDVSSDENEHPDAPIKRCRALGEGYVDFREVYEVIKESGYDGIICVEVDWPRICNYETAMVSRKYLHNVLKL